jgi:hypothetical protein
MSSLLSRQSSPAALIGNLAKFFERAAKGDGQVWATSNVKTGDSLQIQLQDANRERIRVPELLPGAPICLSTYATLDEIKNSPDVKMGVARGVILLHTTEEAEDWYRSQASELNVAVEDLVAHYEKEATAALMDVPYTDGAKEEAEQEKTRGFNEMVISMCQKASSSLREGDRIPALDILKKFVPMASKITNEELEYIKTATAYSDVTKWAEKELAKRANMKA